MPLRNPDESVEILRLTHLPHDVLFKIFDFCEVETLAKLAQVCRLLCRLLDVDCVWLRRSKATLITSEPIESSRKRCLFQLSPKEKCYVAERWIRAKAREVCLLKHKIRYLPWLEMDSRYLWYSFGNRIVGYRRKYDGTIDPQKNVHILGNCHFTDDFCKFVRKDGIIVAGSRNGNVTGWSEDTGKVLFVEQGCHLSDVHCVELHSDLILSGSRDATIQMHKWTRNSSHGLITEKCIQVRDRIWSLAISPCGRRFVSGSAGYGGVCPLQLFDLNSGRHLVNLATTFRKGAGVLDVHFESTSTMISAGYDTFVRLWDLRTNKCELEWSDPHDSSIYCVASDNNNAILTGTAYYGVVRLWDKRSSDCVQMYYVNNKSISQGSSPIYSMVFDSSYLYVALDKSLNLLDFSGHH